MKTISFLKKKEKFTNCFLSDEETEGRLFAVNEKFLAISKKDKDKKKEGLLIVDSSKHINLNQDLPVITWNNKKIYDIEFSPLYNNILASCYEDFIFLLVVPQNGLNNNLTTNQYSTYSKHNNRINFVNFNPMEPIKILSSTIDGEINVWNLENRENYISLKTDNNPSTVSWNPNGILIGATTKSDNINIFDTRDKNICLTKNINECVLSSKYVWVDDHYFSTLSWTNKNDCRILKLWDMNKLDKEINSINIDSSINIGIPLVNRENKLLYIFGKEEKPLYVFDYSKGIFEKKNKFVLNEPSIYSVRFNRKNLDNNESEIDKFAIYSSNNKIYYLSYDKKIITDNLSALNEKEDL